MPDIKLTATPVLGGADISMGSNRILERFDLALVSLAISPGERQSFADMLEDAWSLALPDPRCSSEAQGIRALPMSPDQVMLVFQHTKPGAQHFVQDQLGGVGYTTDQTDAWVALEISGPATPAALERLCPLDLDPASFPDGAAARTLMAHLSIMIVRLGAEHFLLLSASSSAGSFLEAVKTSYDWVVSA